MKPTQKTHRLYYDPEHLLRLYHWIEEYRQHVGYPPTYSDVITAGFCASTSTVRYLYDRMVEFGMISFFPFIARGVKLLPLELADPAIQKLITKKDTPNASN